MLLKGRFWGGTRESAFVTSAVWSSGLTHSSKGLATSHQFTPVPWASAKSPRSWLQKMVCFVCLRLPPLRASQEYMPSVLKQPCRLSGSTVSPSTQSSGDGGPSTAQTGGQGAREEARRVFKGLPKGEQPAQHREEPDLLTACLDTPIPAEPRTTVTCSCSAHGWGHQGLPERRAESGRVRPPNFGQAPQLRPGPATSFAPSQFPLETSCIFSSSQFHLTLALLSEDGLLHRSPPA